MSSIWTVLSYMGLAVFVSCAAAYHFNEFLVGIGWGYSKPMKRTEEAQPKSIAATTSR